MDFDGIAQLLLRDSASPADVVIAFAGLAILIVPVLTVVGLPTTAPTRAMFTVDIFRLPIAHTFSAAKIVLFYFGILAAKFLPAPIAVKKATAPPQEGASAFAATSKLLGFSKFRFQTVSSHLKIFAANRALKSWSGCVGFTIRPLTVV